MSAATITPTPAPTAEAIQEALGFLKNLAEQKTSNGSRESSSSDAFKTIEAALKNSAESKTNAVSCEDNSGEEPPIRTRHAAAKPAPRVNNRFDFDADDDDDEDDNEFAGEYYWDPAPEWKTVGLVAGGAALVGLGALLYNLFDN